MAQRLLSLPTMSARALRQSTVLPTPAHRCAAPAAGERVGAYRLEEMIGAGGSSEVFLATHVELRRQVAIKFLAPQLVAGPDARGRLLQEARLVNSVGHLGVAKVLDVVQSDVPPRIGLVMEHVLGPSLRELCDQGLDHAQAISVSLQIIAAVQAMHGAGVIHRDLEPEHILFTDDPRTQRAEPPMIKIIDFGIARSVTDPVGQTRAGVIGGTPAHLAPEQLTGHPATSTATDVFAIGAIIYELLTGVRPYPGSPRAVIRAKLRGAQPDLRDAGVFEPLLRRCLARSPAHRPSLETVRETLIDRAPQPRSVLLPAVIAPCVTPRGQALKGPIPEAETERMDTNPHGPQVVAAPKVSGHRARRRSPPPVPPKSIPELETVAVPWPDSAGLPAKTVALERVPPPGVSVIPLLLPTPAPHTLAPVGRRRPKGLLVGPSVIIPVPRQVGPTPCEPTKLLPVPAPAPQRVPLSVASACLLIAAATIIALCGAIVLG